MANSRNLHEQLIQIIDTKLLNEKDASNRAYAEEIKKFLADDKYKEMDKARLAFIVREKITTDLNKFSALRIALSSAVSPFIDITINFSNLQFKVDASLRALLLKKIEQYMLEVESTWFYKGAKKIGYTTKEWEEANNLKNFLDGDGKTLTNVDLTRRLIGIMSASSYDVAFSRLLGEAMCIYNNISQDAINREASIVRSTHHFALGTVDSCTDAMINLLEQKLAPGEMQTIINNTNHEDGFIEIRKGPSC